LTWVGKKFICVMLVIFIGEEEGFTILRFPPISVDLDLGAPRTVTDSKPP